MISQVKEDLTIHAARPGIGKKGAASPLVWIGGKHQLSNRIVKLMPAHAIYCEVFAGAAHVFFRKTPSHVEALNDINGELINFFRILKSQPEALLAEHHWALYSRQEFYRLRDIDLQTLDACQRAWRFLYLNRCCFGGRMNRDNQRGATFGVDKSRGQAIRWLRPAFGRRLEEACARLKDAVIENLDWRMLLDVYDRPETFFYLDPPYMGTEHYYTPGGFGPDDFSELAERLAGLRGKFLLSINDCARARELFARFRLLAEPQVNYSACRTRNIRKSELLYGNYEPEA